MYAVYRVRERLPPYRSALSYGLDNTMTYIEPAENTETRLVEVCPSIRVASASVALRNAVAREITAMIDAAVKRSAPAELIAALTGMRDADPKDPRDLVEVVKTARGFLKSHGIDRARSWSDDIAINARLGKKLAKYQTERERSQK